MTANSRRIVRRSTTFADAIATAIDDSKDKGWIVGTITTLSPMNVNAFGIDYGSMSHLASYTPVVNDVVLILASGQQTIILGKIVT